MLLRFVDRHRWLLDLQLAGDALIVSAFIYFTAASPATSRRCTSCRLSAAARSSSGAADCSWRRFSTVLYVGLVFAQYPRGVRAALRSLVDGLRLALPVRAVAQYTVALNVFGFFAVASPERVARRTGLRTAGAQLAQASTEIADLQALNQHVNRQPAERPGDDRFGAARPDVQPRGGVDYRHACASAIGRKIDEVLSCPRKMIDSIQSDLLREEGDAAARVPVPPRRRPRRSRDWSHGHAPRDAPRPRGLLFTFQDVRNIKKLERDAAFSSGWPRRRDGRRHRS